jgi:hypothetical protein
MIGLVMALVAAVVLVDCSEQPSSGVYGSHGYSCCTEVTGTTSWHPGHKLMLHWTPLPPGMTTDSTPRPIVLNLSLSGPYPTVDALKHAISQGSTSAGVRTVNGEPITVDDRTYATPASTLNLPSDLAPGYYNLAAKSSFIGSSAGGAIVIILPCHDQPGRPRLSGCDSDHQSKDQRQ